MYLARTCPTVDFQKVESGTLVFVIAMCKPFILDWRKPLKIS